MWRSTQFKWKYQCRQSYQGPCLNIMLSIAVMLEDCDHYLNATLVSLARTVAEDATWYCNTWAFKFLHCLFLLPRHYKRHSFLLKEGLPNKVYLFPPGFQTKLTSPKTETRLTAVDVARRMIIEKAVWKQGLATQVRVIFGYMVGLFESSMEATYSVYTGEEEEEMVVKNLEVLEGSSGELDV